MTELNINKSDSLVDSSGDLVKPTFAIPSLVTHDKMSSRCEMPENTLKSQGVENEKTVDVTLTPKDKGTTNKKINHKSVASTTRKNKKKVVINLSDSSGDENIPPKTDFVNRKPTSVNRQPQRRISFSSDDSDDDNNKVRDDFVYRSPDNTCNLNDSNPSDASFENFLTKYKTQKSQKPTPSFDSWNDDSFIATTTDEEDDDVPYHVSLKNEHFTKQLVQNDKRERVPKTPVNKTTAISDDVKSQTLPRNHKVKEKYVSSSGDEDKPKDLATRASTKLSFMASLSADADFENCDPEAIFYRKAFVKNREELAYKLYSLFNKKTFLNELPRDMKISWNPNLLTTAGLCRSRYNEKRERIATIEIAPKVVDDTERLRDTLVHEMCHAVAWIVDGLDDNHGPNWKKWARRVNSTFSEIPMVTRCHTYEISKKYTYKCTQCNLSFGRHSKSIDLEKKVCGRCKSRLQLFRGNVECPTTTPRGFAAFVKENYSSVKKSDPQLKHADVMKQLSSEFANKLKVDG